MITLLEPKRGVDDPELPEALRSALLAARADVPSSERLARMAVQLGCAPVLGASEAVSSAAPASGARVVLGSTKGKLVLLASVCVLGGALFYAARSAEVTPGPLPASMPVPAPAPVQGATEASVEPRGPGLEPAQGPREITLPAVAPAKQATPPQPAARTEPKSKARAPLLALDGRARGEGGDIHAELTLLRRAQESLTPAPSRALALCEEHARRYPSGALQQERELIAVVALLRRGDLKGAHARALRFERAFPGSMHAQRLRALLADHKSSDGPALTNERAVPAGPEEPR